MSGSDPMSLEERVARLERLVARLLEQSGEPEAPAAPQPEKERPSGTHEWSWAKTAEEPPPTAPKPSLADQGERWLGRVGVAFVVLAFGFLFRYAFDQGWIGPTFRLVLGFLAATAMLVVGLRLEGARERYSQYLLGGAVGLYYLVGFASYELYDLVPFAVAFAFMCAVTVLAFVLAERQRIPSLAVIGATGGLSTPFLVNTGSGNVPGLVAYTTLLLAGAGAIQFLRGWRSLLMVLGFGGLAVMGLALAQVATPADILERGLVVVGILTAWALFGALPLLRAHLQRLHPEAWPDPPLTGTLGKLVPEARVAIGLLRLGCMVAALLAVLELGVLFDVERRTFGGLYALASLVYLGLSWYLIETRLALNAAAETASAIAILAITLFFFDYRVMLPLAAVAAAMHLSDREWGLPGVRLLAHLIFAYLTLFLVGRLDVIGLAAESPFGLRELAALGAILVALATSFIFEGATSKAAYRIAAHVAFLAWLAIQFGPMQRGQELTSLSWGIYGIGLLLLSLRWGQKGIQLAGLATLGLVAGKLLLVDMAQVDVVWRILLFMGFGGAFLGLSYLINRGSRNA